MEEELRKGCNLGNIHPPRNCKNLGKISGLLYVMNWESELILFMSTEIRTLILLSCVFKELWVLSPLSVTVADV